MGFVKLSTPFILAASLLSFVAQAAPAHRAIKARDYVTEIVTETVWTTIDITTTLYVDELPSTSAPAAASAEVTSSEEIESATEATAVPTVTSTPSSAEESPAATLASSSAAAGEFAESSISPAPEYTAPATPVPAVNPPPAVAATSEAPSPYVAPTPEAPAPSTPATSEIPAPSPSAINPVPENGSCEGGSSCTGDVTHWDGGLGACGTVVDTESDMAIALPHGFMGTLSNSNPYCGRTLTIKTTSGSTVQASVRDKCMGCEGRSIDLTNKLFKAVTDGKGDGREHNIEWWFSD